MIADAFASIAAAFSRAGLDAYHDSVARWPGTPVYDAGGSIVTPGVPMEVDCLCQVDSVTEAMRGEDGYRDKDVRLLILAAGLSKPIDTDAVIDVQAGPSVGLWSVQTTSLDPMGVYWDCRGRRDG